MKSERALLRSVDQLLKHKKKVFVGEPEFLQHPNLPKGAIVLYDERLTGRLKEDGYVVFEDALWQFDKKSSDTNSRCYTAHAVKRLTDKWAKEKRDYDRHIVAIAAFVIGIIGAALTIYRELWK